MATNFADNKNIFLNVRRQVEAFPQFFSELFNPPRKKKFTPMEGFKFIPGSNIQEKRKEPLPTPTPFPRPSVPPQVTPTPRVEAIATPTPMPTREPTRKPEPTATPEPSPTPIQSKLARNPHIVNFRISTKVKSAINKAADQFDIPATLLFDIALQESSFDPSKENLDAPPGLNPQGLFQFTDSTWEIIKVYNSMEGGSLDLPNFNRFDPITNATAAAYLIKFGQLGRWDASKGVWGPYYTDEELESYYSQRL